MRAARVLHLTGITATISDSTRRALDAAHQAGVLVSFDVNHRSRLWKVEQAVPVYRSLTARADLVLAGEDEAELLTGEREPTAQAEAIAAMGPRQVLVKRGEHGAVGFDDSQRVKVSAFTVAAGDTVGAGYLAELITGQPLDQRLRTAPACGAIAYTAPGDWEAAPDHGTKS